MKSHVSIMLGLLTIFACASLVAMEGRGLKRTHYEIYHSPEKSSLPDVITAVKEVPEGGLIAMNGSFINNRELVDALAQAEERGVRVEVCIDSRNAQNNVLLQKLNKKSVFSTVGMHTKRFISFDTDPGDNVNKIARCTGRLITGSENLSGMAGKHHEYTFTTQDTSLLLQHYKDHLYNKSLCTPHQGPDEQAPREKGTQSAFKRRKVTNKNKQAVPTSPEITRLFNSQEYDMGKLKERRIAKPVPRNAHELILISSMGFDETGVANELQKKLLAGSNVYMVVDKSAIESVRGYQLCKKLEDAGGHVFVWMKSTIHHAKLFLRERRSLDTNEYVDSLSILSTGNLCTNSSAEINYDQVVPDSASLSQDIRSYFSSIVSVCTRLRDVDIKALEQARENKKQARKKKKEATPAEEQGSMCTIM